MLVTTQKRPNKERFMSLLRSDRIMKSFGHYSKNGLVKVGFDKKRLSKGRFWSKNGLGKEDFDHKSGRVMALFGRYSKAAE